MVLAYPPQPRKHSTTCTTRRDPLLLFTCWLSIVHLWCLLASCWTAFLVPGAGAATAKEFALPTEAIGGDATATTTTPQTFNDITTRRARADAFLAGGTAAARRPPSRTLSIEQEQQEDRRLQLLYAAEDNNNNNNNNTGNFKSDIIDGIPVPPNTNTTTTPFPSFAVPFGFLERKNSLCGGVLIHADIVLTAGHCRRAWAGYDIYIGATRLDGSDALDTVRAASEHLHPNYTHYPRRDIFRLDNDLLLVVLERPVRDTDLIPPSRWNTDPARPVPGGDPSDDDASYTHTVVGFGATEDNGYSFELLQARVPAVGEEKCRDVYKSPPYFPDTMICAGTDDTTTCAGDSGGPLLDASGGDAVVVGVLSFGKSACDEPDVFVRASAFADWIRDGVCALSAVPPSEDCPARPRYDWPAEPNSWSSDGQVTGRRDYCAGRDPCHHWLWGRGVTMFNAGDLVLDFCWEHCVTFLPEVALFFNWQCGSCPSFY